MLKIVQYYACGKCAKPITNPRRGFVINAPGHIRIASVGEVSESVIHPGPNPSSFCLDCFITMLVQDPSAKLNEPVLAAMEHEPVLARYKCHTCCSNKPRQFNRPRQFTCDECGNYNEVLNEQV